MAPKSTIVKRKSPKRVKAGKKAALTRKRNASKSPHRKSPIRVAAGKKAARTRKRNASKSPEKSPIRVAAGKKAARTKAKKHAVRVAAGKKAARTRKRNSKSPHSGISNSRKVVRKYKRAPSRLATRSYKRVHPNYVPMRSPAKPSDYSRTGNHKANYGA